MDFRLMALEMANDDAVLLRERNAGLEADVDSYRAVATEAIHALHHVTNERDRLRRRVSQLLDEVRALRAQNRRAA